MRGCAGEVQIWSRRTVRAPFQHSSTARGVGGGGAGARKLGEKRGKAVLHRFAYPKFGAHCQTCAQMSGVRAVLAASLHACAR